MIGVLEDYKVLLNLALQTYMISEETKVIVQLNKVLASVNTYSKRERMSVSALNTIGLYIDNLKTYDTSIILPEGKMLL